MKEVRFEVNCESGLPHFHEEMEILFVLSGRVAVMTEGVNFVLGAEDVVVFNSFQHHELYHEAGGHTISAYIIPEILYQARLKSVWCCSALQPEREEYFRMLRAELAAVFQAYDKRQEEWRPYILGQLFSLLNILKQQFEDKEERVLCSRSAAERIGDILRYISGNYSGEISLQQLAVRYYLSESHLSREFKKITGVGFAEYLRTLRLKKAEEMLRHSSRSVTEIALSCGFANTNTFIESFKRRYGCTPGSYKRDLREEQEEVRIDQVSYMNLFRHLQFLNHTLPLREEAEVPTQIKADVRSNKGRIQLCHREIVNLGLAKDLMMEPVRNALRQAREEIGFEYLYFHGLLDDSMGVYHEYPDGTPHFNYMYIDMVIDFSQSLGMRQWIEFGYTPAVLVKEVSNQFGTSCLNLPDDLSKWENLVRHVMQHLVDRYGVETVRKWRFSPSAAVYGFYGVYTMERYMEYYRTTFEAVRSVFPEACISGFGHDTGIVTMSDNTDLEAFLQYCIRYECIPDEFFFQSFCCDYTGINKKETEMRISDQRTDQDAEPVPVSFDSDILEKELAVIRKQLDQHGMQDKKIVLNTWNSTIWQRDLGNDICFKSAFIVKNILENSEQMAAAAYGQMTDYSERMIKSMSVYHGGYGAVTYQGIPKAAYHAFTMLNQLEEIRVCAGRGYTVTRSQDKRKITILLYHYCHYDRETHLTERVAEEMQKIYDRYYGFEKKGVKIFRIRMEGIAEGIYEAESYVVNRNFGSSYDIWTEMGSPEEFTRDQYRYLKQQAVPKYHYDRYHVQDSTSLELSALLEPHEIRLICLKMK